MHTCCIIIFGLDHHMTTIAVWRNSHRSGLPSKDEMENTKLAITNLENSLKEAILNNASDKINELEQELLHRRAWIAPIRLIPVEILSIIFLDTSRMSGKAPFILGGVCRFWRDIILGMPEVWSFIRLNQIVTVTGLPIIIQRGAPYPVKLDILSDADFHLIPIIDTLVERIGCLKIKPDKFKITHRSFSSLTTLVLIETFDKSVFTRNTHALLNGQLFPQLRRLYGGNIFDSIKSPLPSFPIYPPIEELGLVCRNHHLAALICQVLASQLRVLYIVALKMYDPPTALPIEVTFPSLKHLTLLQCGRKLQWNMIGHTPNLESYTQVGSSSGNIHRDVTSVQHLKYKDEIDLKDFQRVQTITTVSLGIEGLLSNLETEPHGFPCLDAIICDFEDEMKARLEIFNSNYGRDILLKPREPTSRLLMSPYIGMYVS